jgi:hypothetical protein
LGAFVVGQLTELGEPLEVVLAGCARSEQHQDRRGVVGLIAEPLHAAGWDVEEVALHAVDPVPAVGASSTR